MVKKAWGFLICCFCETMLKMTFYESLLVAQSGSRLGQAHGGLWQKRGYRGLSSENVACTRLERDRERIAQ